MQRSELIDLLRDTIKRESPCDANKMYEILADAVMNKYVLLHQALPDEGVSAGVFWTDGSARGESNFYGLHPTPPDEEEPFRDPIQRIAWMRVMELERSLARFVRETGATPDNAFIMVKDGEYFLCKKA